ncbi:ABC1 kinase family protein [Gordonia sp. CPCC 205333]|uniref:ABC1 kinase family protein n=1 Tax=Gordonia sp. CPCC 205333 TaxID=3140790 RepID=UPI003AF36857
MSTQQRDGGRVLRVLRELNPNDGASRRTAKVVKIPAVFAGRRAAGVVRRASGHSALDIQRDIHERTAQHIFEVLGGLRGVAAKVGQILSLFDRVLPPELSEAYGTALAQLQESAPIMLPGVVDEALRTSLGPEWHNRFLEFDMAHPKAASIGQVHKAIWHDGRQVAVKIQYPDAKRAIEADLAQLRLLSLAVTAMMPGLEMRPVVDEFCDCIIEELDYAHEAQNQAIFAAAYADDPDILIPQVIEQTGDVLISEWIGGTSLTSLLERGAALAERNRISTQIIQFNIWSQNRCGILYGDAHPGNYRIQADGRLGVIDFGACASLPDDFNEMIVDLVDTLLNGDITDLAAMVHRRRFLSEGRELDITRLKKTLLPYLEPLLKPGFVIDQAWVQQRITEAVDPTLSNVFRQTTFPPNLIAGGRTALGTVGLLVKLNPRISLDNLAVDWIPGLKPVLAQAARNAHRDESTRDHLRVIAGGDISAEE